MSRLAEQLIAAKTLIDSPDKWAQGAFRIGDRICASEAIMRVTGDDEEFMYHPVYRTLRRAMNDQLVCNFNDEHTHAEVMAAFDRAIEEAA